MWINETFFHSLYLSDFSYGERLVLFDNSMKYAYINLLEDSTYSDFIEKVKTAISSHRKQFSESELQNIINHMFAMTCDKIQGCDVDFVNKDKKCIFCVSKDFEDLMTEPESIVCIDVPEVTHEVWRNMSEEEKIQMIENYLVKNKII